MNTNHFMSFLISLLFLIIFGCVENQSKTIVDHIEDTAGCLKNEDNALKNLSCKLTSLELQKRKETVIADLKASVIERKELPDGVRFKFNGDDQTLDKLTEFIKTERACCGFFTFNLSVAGDKSEIWLELKGGEGTKDFIKAELEM